MLIAKELRKTNIAEYILYMWQIEDLLRACKFDDTTIEQQLVSRFKAQGEQQAEIAAWYKNLSLMMEKEQVQEKGHIQVLINLVNDLNEFHMKLIETGIDPEYLQLYRINTGAIAELAENSQVNNDVLVCLNALYGYMLLKLKSIEISPETHSLIENFARLVGHLSARYIQFENDDFEF